MGQLKLEENGKLLANGVQVGSTSYLYENSYSTAYTTFSLGSSLIVEPGSPVTLKVVADIYDGDGTNNIATDYTITARLEGDSSWNNAMGVSSSTTIDVPASDKDGNELTVKEGSLTFAEYTSYTDQTVVAPLDDYKLAHFTLTADTTEAVNISTIAVTLNAVSSYASDLWVKYGTQETSRTASITSATNSYSVNYALDPGETVDVEVYVDVSSGMTSNTGQASVLISGTTADSATSVTGPSSGTALGGQTITFSSGSISSAVAGYTPLNQIVAGNQEVTAGKFKITAVNDNYTVTELKFLVGATATSQIIKNAILKDGDTILATRPYDTTTLTANDTAYFTGLNISVPRNTSKTLTLNYDLGIPCSDVNSSQVDAKATLSWFKHMNSLGSISTDSTDRVANELYVVRSVPTVSKVALDTNAISSGQTVDVYKWTVAASGGTEVDVRQMKLGVTWTDASSDSADLELESFKLYKGSTDISSLVEIVNEDGADITDTTGAVSTTDTIVVSFNTEDTIGAGTEATYKLVATARGFDPTTVTHDDSVTVYLKDDSTVNDANYKYIEDTSSITALVDSSDNNEPANFIWSDNSAVSHSSTSASSSGDWMNGYLVQSLPLSTQVLYGP